MRGFPKILSISHNEFNQFSIIMCLLIKFTKNIELTRNSIARMLDSIYHMTLKLFCNQVYRYENV